MAEGEPKFSEDTHNDFAHERLPVTDVRNVCVWAPSDMGNLPFRENVFSVGKESPLGKFLSGERKGITGRILSKLTRDRSGEIEATKGHGRSGIIGRAYFTDSAGLLYRDLDIKGLGLIGEGVSGRLFIDLPGRSSASSNEPWGLLREGRAMYDAEISERLIREGFRTAKPIAILRLQEIIDNGRRISTKKAVEKGIIQEDVTPVLFIRAFGVKSRLFDVAEPTSSGWIQKPADESRKLIDDAKGFVAKELHVKELSDLDYLTWFSGTLGKQLAILHRTGYFSTGLDASNTTLDCRVVDLDTINEMPSDQEAKETNRVANTNRALDILTKVLLPVVVQIGRVEQGEEESQINEGKIKKIFLDSYNKDE